MIDQDSPSGDQILIENSRVVAGPRPRNIHESIVAVMREIGPIARDAENKEQKYDYRSAEAIYNRVQPLFARFGIYSTPEVIEQKRETRGTRKGTTLTWSILTVKYTFWAEDGSSAGVTVVGEGMDAGDKASNKAMTAAHKYAICQLLNVPYQLIDPDKYTPKWAEESIGHVTMASLNDLKSLWVAKHPANGRTKQEHAEMFLDWVKGVVGAELTTKHEDWTRKDLETCLKALEDGTAQD